MPEALKNQPRLLSKQVPPVTCQILDGQVSKGSLEASGWKKIRCNNYPAVDYRNYFGHWSYIDLAGYKQSDLTFVITGAEVSNAAPPSGTGEGFIILDLLTTVPYVTLGVEGSPIGRTGYTLENNQPWYAGQNTPSPGMPDSILEMEQVILCQKSTYYHDTGWSTTNLQQLAAINTYGQCAAIAGDRIYTTRIIMGLPSTVSITDVQIPSCVYNITGMAIEEDDMAYIMRLRRDYELAKPRG